MESEIRKMCAGFAAAELSPRGGGLDTENPALLKTILSKAAENGFFSFLLPEESGGAGLGPREYLVFLEELAGADGAVASAFAAHSLGLAPLLLNIDKPGAASLLASIPRIEKSGAAPLFSLALKEDKSRNPVPAVCATTLEGRGGSLVVTGRKTGVFCAGAAHCFVATCRCADGKTAVAALPAASKGVSIAESRPRLGLRLCPIDDVSFTAVEIPEENILERDLSPGRLLEYFNFAGPGFAAVFLGMMKSAYSSALKYSTERYQGGKIICGHDAIKIMLGNMLEAVRTTESLLRDGASGMGAACFAAEAAEKVCLDAIQVLGGYGYMKDFPLERILRDVKTLKAIVNPAAWRMKFIEDSIKKTR